MKVERQKNVSSADASEPSRRQFLYSQSAKNKHEKVDDAAASSCDEEDGDEFAVSVNDEFDKNELGNFFRDRQIRYKFGMRYERLYALRFDICFGPDRKAEYYRFGVLVNFDQRLYSLIHLLFYDQIREQYFLEPINPSDQSVSKSFLKKICLNRICAMRRKKIQMRIHI